MTSPTVDAVLGPGGLLAGVLPGYEHRPQQLAMAAAVERAMAHDTPLLVEAGTGTGKTLAYLVPAILSGKKVVVSTGSKTLQEQIHRKDIPLLAAHLGVPVEAVLLKGITNYLCLRRLAEVGDTDDPALVEILAWARRTETGDRAELAGVPDEAPAWRLVTTTPDARLGPRCPFFERCFVTRARRAAQKAQLVVVNHHLFFADLALRAAYPGAQVLPDYDAVIFDEAHQLEEILTEHFGLSVSTHRVAALVRDARRALVQVPGLADSDACAAADRVDLTEARADDLFSAVRQRLAELPHSAPVPASGDERRLAAPPDLFADGPRRDRWLRLDAALEDLALYADRLSRDGEREDAAAVARRAQALRADLAAYAEREGARRLVHWAELRGRAVHLRASPLEVGDLFRRHVVEPVGAVVLTSATLTAGGRFDFVRARLGLHDLAEELSVDSPFDYARQALLYLPRDLPSPQDPAFLDAALDRTVDLLTITSGRAFVLFTSHRSLRVAAERLRTRVPWPLLVQGDEARPALLERFRAVPGSVLLATSSFWEGIDVPGEALSLVVLEKLPFAAPDDPLTSARLALLEERGEDPFHAYQVPRAALALKQGFGRLIRRRDDRGIVAILDHRILTKSYGRTFLASLPPAARTSSLEQARRWWN